jgi:hypothetical protein
MVTQEILGRYSLRFHALGHRRLRDAAVVLSGFVADRPKHHVLPAGQSVVNDRLTFCIMVPHSLDNRCASSLAISTRCQYALLI